MKLFVSNLLLRYTLLIFTFSYLWLSS